jgi:hypothetical protein
VAQRLTQVLKPDIQAFVELGADKADFEGVLRKALKGSKTKYEEIVKAIIRSSLTPHEFVELVEQDAVAQIAERTELDEGRVRRIVDALRDSAVLYEIEIVEMEDRPRLELLHGNEYKDTRKTSPGQKATIILPILLQDDLRVLCIDQPEDNLDGRFIYTTVVKFLLAAKGGRQVIVATHNPNIPVLGEAEQHGVMQSDGPTGSLAATGDVDKVKPWIEAIMEGGREAFLRRKERYGY